MSPQPLEFFEALYRNTDGWATVSGKIQNGSGLMWEDGYKAARIGDDLTALLCDGEPERWFRVQPQAERLGRDETNTAGVVTLIADFDFPGSSDKKKLDPFTNLMDVSRFCREHVPLPVSAVVLSGHGAHVYWFLTETLAADEGAQLLYRFDLYLRARAKAEGKQLDAMHDTARVLRVPGSINAKHPDKPRSVILKYLYPDRTYTPDDFDWLPEATASTPGDTGDVPTVEQLPEPLPQRIERHYEASVGDRSLAMVHLVNDCVREGFTPGQIWNAVQSHSPSRDKYAHRGDSAWWKAVANLMDTADDYTTEYEVTVGGEPATESEGDTFQLPDHLALYKPGDLGGFIPPISDTVLQGPIGEWLTLIEPETEASTEALGAGVLAALGARLGSQVGLNVGRIRHRTNLFVVTVGPSGRARKGTADGEARSFVRQIDPVFASDHIASGFGSGEAVVERLRDPVYDDEGVLVAGSLDQRLLVNEGELAQVFRVMSRQGSILSDVIRDAFDGRTLENNTKGGGQLRSTNACVSLSGGITPDELVELAGALSAVNGVGSRFLWIWSNPTKLLPDGGDDVDLESVVYTIKHRGPHVTYERTPEAAAWWREHYADLRDTPHLHPSVHAITNRTTDHVQRIALIYAASEGTAGLVDVRHLEAGQGWVDHSHTVVQSVLGGLVRDSVAGKILASLRRHPGTPTTVNDVYELLNRNSTAAEIHSGIESLTRSGLAWSWKGESTGGRPPQMLIATTPKSEVPK